MSIVLALMLALGGQIIGEWNDGTQVGLAIGPCYVSAFDSIRGMDSFDIACSFVP